MVTVALVGATTGFGLTLLRHFLANPGSHKIVLLSRSPQPALAAQGVDVRPVDYTDHPALVHALSDVHTVLSLASTYAEDAQLALLAAAKEAGVRRFAPSEYAGNGYDGIDLYAGKGRVWEAVKASGIEHTRLACGLFMNILATGTPKPATPGSSAKTGEEEALAGSRPWDYVVNVRAGTADLPGDGSAKAVFTEMTDVARFTVAALDLDTWPEELGMRGQVLSFREVAEVVGKVQGRQFLFKETSLEEMARVAEEQPAKRFYNQTRIRVAEGWAMVGDELNVAFPAIKPVSVEEFVEKWWTGVKLGEPNWKDDVSFG
ncbi:hypothetical protein MBLNU459_g0448t1 [Dothideomycetes sp. NU459]